VQGSSALRRLLQSERGNLARAPVLLVSSGETPQSESFPKVHTACEGTKFMVGMEFGFRSVPATVTSAYPTVEDVKKATELIKRLGATSVIGVGSGAAIDLAKAVFQEDDATNNLENLILAPATRGAALAAGASRSILLDPHEETLVLEKHHGHDDDENAVHIAIDPKMICDTGPASVTDAIFASIAIGVDSIYSSDGVVKRPDQVISALRCGLEALHALDHQEEGSSSSTAHELTVEALFHAGELLSYGTGTTNRNITLACVSSILPISFPQAQSLTFISSLLPGLFDTFQDAVLMEGVSSDEVGTLVQRVQAHSMYEKIPSLSSLAVDSTANFDVASMLKQVHTNQSVWNCLDVDDAILEEVLHRSLTR